MTPLALGATRGGSFAPRAATVRRGAGARPGPSGGPTRPSRGGGGGGGGRAVRPRRSSEPGGWADERRSLSYQYHDERTHDERGDARRATRGGSSGPRRRRSASPRSDPLGGHPRRESSHVGSLQSSSSSPGRGARDVRRDRGPRRDARDTFTGPNHRRRRRRRAHSDASLRRPPASLRRVRETTTRRPVVRCARRFSRPTRRASATSRSAAPTSSTRRAGPTATATSFARSRCADTRSPRSGGACSAEGSGGATTIRGGRAGSLRAGPTRRSGPGPTLPRPSRLRRRGVRRHNTSPPSIALGTRRRRLRMWTRVVRKFGRTTPRRRRWASRSRWTRTCGASRGSSGTRFGTSLCSRTRGPFASSSRTTMCWRCRNPRG